MAAKLIRLTYKIAIQLLLVAESYTIWSCRSRRPVQKLMVTYNGSQVRAPSCRVNFAICLCKRKGKSNAIHDVLSLHESKFLGICDIFFQKLGFLITKWGDLQNSNLRGKFSESLECNLDFRM